MTTGGKRPGAGRPIGTTKATARRGQVNLRLTAEEMEKADGIGNGNVSCGLRAALAAYAQAGDELKLWRLCRAAKRKQVNLRLSSEEIDKAQRLGAGNVSAGLRWALAAWPTWPPDQRQ